MRNRGAGGAEEWDSFRFLPFRETKPAPAKRNESHLRSASHAGPAASLCRVVSRTPGGADMAERRPAELGSRRGEDVVDGRAGDIRQQVAVHPERVAEHRDGELAIEPQRAKKVHGLLLVPEPFRVHDPPAFAAGF